MTETEFVYKINKMNMKHGDPIVPGRINVFVGENNCGKTQLLKDMLNYITGKREENVIISGLDVEYPDSWAKMDSSYKLNIVDVSQGLQLRHLSPTLDKEPTGPIHHDLRTVLDGWLNGDKLQFRSATGAGFVTYLNTDNRLNLAMGKQVQKDLRQRGAKNVLEALYESGSEATQKVRDCMKAIFDDLDVYLDASNLGMIQFRVSKDFSSMPENLQEVYEQLKNVAVLDDQGDGVRSVLGIIASIVAVKKPIILLDEPEAFLHPPQALQLGKIISGLISEDQQIFVSTHSADFLRGLLGTTKDSVVIHLDRVEENATEANVLDAEVLNQIVTDPLLSSGRVLEGMFYKGVVATEADSDATFYQRMFQKVGAADEIHFLHTPGKQALKKIISPYKKLGIKLAIIADADVIREASDVKALIELTQDETVKSNILAKRKSVLEYFQTISKLERLKTINLELQMLINQELPESDDDETVDVIFAEYRAKLGKLRADSDDLSELKKKGREAFPAEEKKAKEAKVAFDELCDLCASIGLFIVWVGELESWLDDYEITRTSNKAKWIVEALTQVYHIEPDTTRNIWKFIYSLKEYLIS